MGRISISCLLPASWHFSLSPAGCPRVLSASLRRRLLLAAAAALLLGSLLLLRDRHRDRGRFQRYLARVTDTEATDTRNPNLNYGIVVDCGSSGSRVFVYCWPRHNGNPKDLLDIQQMRDSSRKPVVMKIKPGTGKNVEFLHDFLSGSQREALDSHTLLAGLLFFWEFQPNPSFFSAFILVEFCSQQKAILEDLLTDIPVHFDFLFSDSHAEVISGKQEGVYAWIGINFVLGRFEHTDDEDEAVVEVQVPGSEHHDPVFRKRTVGILDMGGVSTQIAYEVPQNEEVAKSLLAEVNLGCDAHQTEHVYRVYVATFLGFGGNAARRRYEESLFSSSLLRSRCPEFPGNTLGRGAGVPKVKKRDQFTLIPPQIPNVAQNIPTKFGIFLTASAICCYFLVFGVSDHFFSSRIFLLGAGGLLGSFPVPVFPRFSLQDYCATRWSVLRERFERGLYAPHADLHRLKFQCFKSAWMFEVFHRGFSFPESYGSLKTALQVYDKEVQWTLGAILYRTRFLPLRYGPGAPGEGLQSPRLGLWSPKRAGILPRAHWKRNSASQAVPVGN
uniref:ectonucleoside triphosphate diphosphohydrolase 4 n=1 Tax=Lonchura striata TaxID=40157 RepID=UPI0012933A0E|nr:ectonucleoside triphosphate diphosphohydrolase 4 [Lonchura striata domestica]